MSTKSHCVIVHGGLSTTEDPWIIEKVSGCMKSAARGYNNLVMNQNATDAVEDALWWLENDEFFNCGYGSAPSSQNFIEMDASIMNGSTMQCGTVLGLTDVEHPISVARYFMDNYSNKIFTNHMIERMNNMPKFCMGPGDLNRTALRTGRLDETVTKRCSSCACICWDGKTMVVGSSGGGVQGKQTGAVSEAGVVGCGLYASEQMACAVTGPLDSLITLNLASQIISDAEEDECCPERTLKLSIDNMLKKSNETAGGIVLHANGCAGVYFTAPCMPYAVVKDGWIVYGFDASNRHYQKYSLVGEPNICQCDTNEISCIFKPPLP